MVDLFEDCIILGLLFINVGIDIFGFWIIIMRKICGGVVNLKCLVIIFICLIM